MKFKLKCNKIVEIRQALTSDAEDIIEYMHKINIETKNLLREPNEFNMTLKEEAMYLEKAYNSNDEYMFSVWDKEKLISVTGFHGINLQRIKHKVTFGMSVLKEYQNQGLGTKLMDLLCDKAREMGKTKIELDVREDNKSAIRIYEKTGFLKEGIRTQGFLVDGKYINLVLMGKALF